MKHTPRDIANQHNYLDPKHIDYLSLRVHDKAEKTYDLIAILKAEGELAYKTLGLGVDVRATPFDSAKEARHFADLFYKHIPIQRG